MLAEILMVFLEIKEYKKIWNKNYREANREKLKEKDRKYYHENKESIEAKQGQKVICECGCELRRDGMRRHITTKRHLDLMTKK